MKTLLLLLLLIGGVGGIGIQGSIAVNGGEEKRIQDQLRKISDEKQGNTSKLYIKDNVIVHWNLSLLF